MYSLTPISYNDKDIKALRKQKKELENKHKFLSEHLHPLRYAITHEEILRYLHEKGALESLENQINAIKYKLALPRLQKEFLILTKRTRNLQFSNQQRKQ